MTRASCLAAAALLAAAPARAAPGEPPRVVLVGPEPALSRALGTALAPWDIELADRPRGGGDPATEARAIAAGSARVAVVWVAVAGEGQALFVYDGSNGQLVTRPLGAAGPLDEPLAAAAALSVKTMLRFTSVAPAPERLGGDVAAAAPPRLRGEAFGGGRVAGALPGGRVEPAFGFGISYWPRAAQGRLGLALEARLGTGLAVDAAGFAGRLSDVAASGAARFRLRSGRWSLLPAVGATLHVVSLQGSTSLEGPVGRSRVNPSLDAGVRLERALGRALEIGVAAGGAYVLRQQRYLLAGEPLWQTAAYLLQADLFVGFPFL